MSKEFLESVLKGLWKKIKAYKKIQDDPNYEKDDD